MSSEAKSGFTTKCCNCGHVAPSEAFNHIMDDSRKYCPKCWCEQPKSAYVPEGKKECHSCGGVYLVEEFKKKVVCCDGDFVSICPSCNYANTH